MTIDNHDTEPCTYECDGAKRDLEALEAYAKQVRATAGGFSCIPMMRDWIRKNAPQHMRRVWSDVLDVAETAIEYRGENLATTEGKRALKSLWDAIDALEKEMMT